MPRPSLHEYEARRIALVKPSALGDIVHALPVLTAVRERYPRARITWVVNQGYAPLLQGHPDLDEVLPFDRKAAGAGWVSAGRTYSRFFRELRRRDFDLVLDLQGLLRSGLMAAASGAARRVGLRGAREGARWFYTDIVSAPGRQEGHAVDRYWCMAEVLGAGGGPKRFRVPLVADAAAWAERELRGVPRPWLVLAVGSRWPTKRWLPAHFAELARCAQAEFGGTVLFVGGADEATLAEAVRTRLEGPSLDLSGRTTLPQLAAVLARADAVLANDTGPLHLANALGRPVAAPYTCTQVRLTGPYGSFHRAVETTVWCGGSCRRRCGRMECMAELTPGRLWPVLCEVLQSWQSRSRPA
jgi:lipopolysaccharide heptosyltransferase I